MKFFEPSAVPDYESYTIYDNINRIFFLPLCRKSLGRVFQHINDAGRRETTTYVQAERKGIYRLIIPKGTTAPITEITNLFKTYNVEDSFCFLRTNIPNYPLLQRNCGIVNSITTSEMVCYAKYRIAQNTVLDRFGFYVMEENDSEFYKSLEDINSGGMRNLIASSYTIL